MESGAALPLEASPEDRQAAQAAGVRFELAEEFFAPPSFPTCKVNRGLTQPITRGMLQAGHRRIYRTLT